MLKTLSIDGLRQFLGLQSDAVSAVTERFYATHDSLYEHFGAHGREACREDLAFHLEFLRPVLEFGLLQPMVDYLHWLNSVLSARAVPTEHLSQSLDWLAAFYAERMEVSDGEIVVAALLSAQTSFQKISDMPLVPLTSHEPWLEMAEFEASLLSGNHREAHAILQRCIAQGRSLIDFELHIIQPALYGIGEKWQTNQVSIAQEHMATAIAQSVMTVALQNVQPQVLIDKRVLLACVEGNNHALGLQMVADAFLIAGWEVQFLGSNVPTSSLIRQTVEWKPDLIGLSVSFPQQVRVAKAVIIQLNERIGSTRPAVIIGGLAFNRFSGLVDMVGADIFAADSRTAIEYANRVVSI